MRLNLYLNAKERMALENLAFKRGTSMSYIVRLALRKELGMSLPDADEVGISTHLVPLARDRRMR